MIIKLITTEPHGPIYINNPTYSVLFEPTVGGVHINRELYNVYNKEKSYVSNAAICRDITFLQMEQLITYLVEHNQYIFGTNNCATVATGAWKTLFAENYMETSIGFIVDPNKIKKKLEVIENDYVPTEIKFKEILAHNEKVLTSEKSD